MGYFSARCVITGVSLEPCDTTLVLVQEMKGHYAPIALPMTGKYNFLGSLEYVYENTSTDLLLTFFRWKIEVGESTLSEGNREYLQSRGEYPPQNIEQLLNGYIGQGISLNGRPVYATLICSTVWQAIADGYPRKDSEYESALTMYERVTQHNAIALKIYDPAEYYPEDYEVDEESEFSEEEERHLRLSDFFSQWSLTVADMERVDSFLNDRGLTWKPNDECGRHFEKDLRQCLQEAKQTFSDSALILIALESYERDMNEYIKDHWTD